MAFFKSTPERVQKISTLRPEQEQLFSQLLQALGGQQAGGAFGDIADYYRGLLGGEGADEFEAPLMRQFQEDILPGIAEQFAGLGAGGLSSSAFAQESGRASTDLAERLGSLRAGLRQQGAEGLRGLSSGAFAQVDENILRPRQPGLAESFLTSVGPGIGKGLGLGLGSPFSSVKSFLET